MGKSTRPLRGGPGEHCAEAHPNDFWCHAFPGSSPLLSRLSDTDSFNFLSKSIHMSPHFKNKELGHR